MTDAIQQKSSNNIYYLLMITIIVVAIYTSVALYQFNNALQSADSILTKHDKSINDLATSSQNIARNVDNIYYSSVAINNRAVVRDYVLWINDMNYTTNIAYFGMLKQFDCLGFNNFTDATFNKDSAVMDFSNLRVIFYLDVNETNCFRDKIKINCTQVCNASVLSLSNDNKIVLSSNDNNETCLANESCKV